jgi:hypothetical protein
MATEQSGNVPPYVSWGVFKSTIDTLAETTVPSGPLDRRVLHGLSGADHGALISALRYLGLVDSERRATDEYSVLIEESKYPEKFREKLMELLDAKYKHILERVDLERGTISELEKAFKEEGVSQGQMLTKTVRFFIKAYTEGAGLGNMSVHITKPKPKARAASKATNGDSKARGRAGKSTEKHTPPIAPPTDTTPKGFARMPIPGLDDAFIQYPLDLTAAQCTLLEGAVAFLKVYVTGKIDKGATK